MEQSTEEFDCLVVYVPTGDAAGLRHAIAAAGAGRLGNYVACSFSVDGMGRFTPLDGARPAIGQIGHPEEVPETRIEAVYPRARRDDVVRALLTAHPYETPAFMTFPVNVSLPRLAPPPAPAPGPARRPAPGQQPEA